MLARLGQQSESDTNEFWNVTPCLTSSFWTFGIDQSVSQRWSSVRITITFVRVVLATTTLWVSAVPVRPLPAVPLSTSTAAATISTAAATASHLPRSLGVIVIGERTRRY